jgi:hypothetical protein
MNSDSRIARPGAAGLGKRCRSLGFRLLVLAALVLAVAGPAHANGLVINATFDSSITGDPNAATIEATINSAICTYETMFSDSITVNITFKEVNSGLGANVTFFANIPYSTYLTALTADATTANDATALASLPAGPNNPVTGNLDVSVKTANLRAVGINVNPPSGQPDSTISLNTSIMNLSRGGPQNPAKFDLMAVTQHEIDEALGFSSALNNLNNGAPAPTGPVFPEDLFRYDQNGNRTLTTNINAQAFFSINGGVTDLARFNQTAPGDFSDWFSPGGQTPQVQDAFGTPGAQPNLGVELTALDVIGYDLAAKPTPEPATLALLGTGLLIVARRRFRNQRAS